MTNLCLLWKHEKHCKNGEYNDETYLIIPSALKVLIRWAEHSQNISPKTSNEISSILVNFLCYQIQHQHWHYGDTLKCKLRKPLLESLVIFLYVTVFMISGKGRLSIVTVCWRACIWFCSLWTGSNKCQFMSNA